MFVAGDIGGTHARLVLLGPSGRTLQREVFVSRNYASLEAVLREFLGRPVPRVSAAAFGLPGPVVNQRFVGTNLPWTVDARSLSRKLGIKRVTLLNDLVALSLGAIATTPSKLVPLGGSGAPKRKGGNIAVLAAGTGLGEAILVWDGKHHVASPTEGGHTDFAPRDDLEIELLHFLRSRFGHVSYERVLSGNGLANLYDFFHQAKELPESGENAQILGGAPDRNAAIAELGLEGRSEPAARAVELFATIYGAEAGNLALKSLAVGGVYVCGNIANRMLPVLSRGDFRRAFADKGRFASLMEKVPVAVVRDPGIGLVGATRVAMGK